MSLAWLLLRVRVFIHLFNLHSFSLLLWFRHFLLVWCGLGLELIIFLKHVLKGLCSYFYDLQHYIWSLMSLDNSGPRASKNMNLYVAQTNKTKSPLSCLILAHTYKNTQTHNKLYAYTHTHSLYRSSWTHTHTKSYAHTDTHICTFIVLAFLDTHTHQPTLNYMPPPPSLSTYAHIQRYVHAHSLYLSTCT